MNGHEEAWTDAGPILEVQATDLVDLLDMGDNEGSRECREGTKYA